MMMNNPHPNVAETPRELMVYGGILEILLRLEEDQSLLIANASLVPQWATWKHFNDLERKGLAM